MKEKRIDPAKVIFAGSKLLFLELNNPVSIRFLDSYKFLTFPLSSLPKSFELETDIEGGISSRLCKGYFPHLFNRKENEDYIGPYPPPDCYSYSSMKPKACDDFFRWYADRTDSGELFDFKKEIIEYCKNDVVILRLACLKFRDLVYELTGIDAFHKNITLASLAMRIFQTNFITETFQVQLITSRGGTWVAGSNPLGLYPAAQRGGVMRVDILDGVGMRNVSELPTGVSVGKKNFYFDPPSQSPSRWV